MNNKKADRVSHTVKSIIVVDDEKIVRELTEEMLKRLGYAVLSFEDALSALEYYRDNFNTVDLVILDMIMPGMGGREALHNLREINPGVKVFILSGFSLDSENRDMLNEGVASFIQKPVSLSSLRNKLDELFFSDEINPEPVEKESQNEKQTLPLLDGIDTKKALDMLDGDTGLYLKLVERVKTNYKGSSSALIEKYNNEDYEWIYTFAHSIKSLAGNLGAGKLLTDAESVEQSIKHDDKTKLEHLLPVFAQELDAFINLLSSIEPEDSVNSGSSSLTLKPDTEKGNSALTAGYLDELKKAIRVHRPGKVGELIDLLKSSDIPEDAMLILEKIKKAADVYNFRDAGVLVLELENLIQ